MPGESVPEGRGGEGQAAAPRPAAGVPRSPTLPLPHSPTPPLSPGRLLIVNADDFGISEGVNLGIVEANERGILTSTTIMANMPAFEHAVEQAKAHPSLGVGVHLSLTSGNPVLPVERVPHLVGPSGRLLPLGAVLRLLTLDRLPAREVEMELSAQIERAIAAGITPTHLDSHHHVHVHPRLHGTVIRLAKRYGIRAVRATAEMGPPETLFNAGMLRRGDGSRTAPAGTIPPASPNPEGRSGAAETPRARYVKGLGLSILGMLLRSKARRAGLAVPDHFRGLLLGSAFTADQIRPLLEGLPAGATELMTHPGHPDDDLRRRTSYAAGRDSELAALLAPSSRAALERSGTRLGSFAALASFPGTGRADP